jgi:hypothetical protein
VVLTTQRSIFVVFVTGFQLFLAIKKRRVRPLPKDALKPSTYKSFSEFNKKYTPKNTPRRLLLGYNMPKIST